MGLRLSLQNLVLEPPICEGNVQPPSVSAVASVACASACPESGWQPSTVLSVADRERFGFPVLREQYAVLPLGSPLSANAVRVNS